MAEIYIFHYVTRKDLCIYTMVIYITIVISFIDDLILNTSGKSDKLEC